jgi:tetraacyldisaccharide 4'-kinase
MIFEKNSNLISQFQKTALIFASAFQQVGVLAQLVEQWTENPCVPGSIPGDTTRNPGNRKIPGFCFYMSEDIVIRILLFPLALLYGLGVGLRNLLYRVGILRSVRFDLPVISVGNLSVGGAGKSPHIEYLIRWLDQFLDVSVLSRGYGRNTSGYRPVTVIDTAEMVGDEPLQFKRKFPTVPICVSESRALGVPELVKRNPETQVVLLDDAFQHLAVTPGLNILLTEFAHPFTRDWLLPSGRLREGRYNYRRADIIIVTKCPPDLTPLQRQKLVQEIDPFPRQRVYFSRYRYGTPYDLLRPDLMRALDLDTDVLLVSAIANTDYLLKYLGTAVKSAQTMEFEDHHFFKDEELRDMLRRFERLSSRNKILITTEKDAMRLEIHRDFFWKNEIPIYVLPVEVEFLDSDEWAFQEDVKRVLLEFKS